MTVGVISAQKKMLRLLTAWEENMPMMEKAMEKFLFSVSERSADKAKDAHVHLFSLGAMHNDNTGRIPSIVRKIYLV